MRGLARLWGVIGRAQLRAPVHSARPANGLRRVAPGTIRAFSSTKGETEVAAKPTAPAATGEGKPSINPDTSGTTEEQKSEGDSKEEEGDYAGNKYWFGGFFVLALVGGPYALINALQEDEHMRDEWTDEYPAIMKLIREYSPLPVDPPADENPILIQDATDEMTVLLFSKSARLFKVTVTGTAREEGLRAMFEQAKTGEATIESLDGLGAPAEDDALLEIAFFTEDGEVPRTLRDPTEEELLSAIASLESQREWALQNKAKHWWLTENRAVFRDYAHMMDGQIEDGKKKLEEIRNKIREKQRRLDSGEWK